MILWTYNFIADEQYEHSDTASFDMELAIH